MSPPFLRMYGPDCSGADEFQIGKSWYISPVFSYEWQIKDLREAQFVRVANKGLRDEHFSGLPYEWQIKELGRTGLWRVEGNARGEADGRSWRLTNTTEINIGVLYLSRNFHGVVGNRGGQGVKPLEIVSGYFFTQARSLSAGSVGLWFSELYESAKITLSAALSDRRVN
jgi:hypothetical protein